MSATRGNLQSREILIRELLSVLDKGERIRAFEAAKSLIALDAKHTAPKVCRILKTGKTPDNRAAAAYVLGFLAAEQAIACLLSALRESHSVKVRSHAAEALGHAGDKKAVEGLVHALTDRAATVRFWAAFALGEIGSRSALLPLRKLAKEDHGATINGQKVSAEARRAVARCKRQGNVKA